MKLGGLFSGVGGFELAWTQLGHEVAWMCEIDKSARKVLEHRFPGVPVYEDVQELDPAEVEAVDVLTGGSPCQGFSVAGQRAGLLHGESRLFADYVRIMDGLAERGLKWALWENVPGVLSITNDDGERTFPHVAAALAGAGKPLRLGAGRWNSGLADGGSRAVAWRVLDSRYFGVAQRRRRVFACVAFGDSAADRAGRALLAKPQSLSGNFESSESSRQNSSTGIAEGIGDSGSRMNISPKMLFVRGGVEIDRHGKKAGKGPLLTYDEAATLDSGNTWTLFQPQAFDEMNFTTDNQHHVLRAGTKQSTGVVEQIAFRKSARVRSATTPESWVDDGLANTLNTFDAGDVRTTHAIVEPPFYGVRRLTPVECERLQAFPDGWTEPAGSDSARYKAMGNAVTVNTVRWILGRMLEQS